MTTDKHDEGSQGEEGLQGDSFVIVKCPKCGLEIRCDYNWHKVSTTMDCPQCSQLIRIKHMDGD